ncbi:hypothetical protein K474DRAFT_1698997 [Panus rudis PR-1116 ss-1]|nr:hypothetical protein K474DRAFT_1698997 [Panus rudis PR-1116 ss-1]
MRPSAVCTIAIVTVAASSVLAMPVSSTGITVIDAYSPLEPRNGGDLLSQNPRRIYKRVHPSSSQGSSSSRSQGSSSASGSSSLPQSDSRSNTKGKAKAPGMVHIGFVGKTLAGEPARQDAALDDTQQWANDNANRLGAKGNKASSVGHAADGFAVNRRPEGNEIFDFNRRTGHTLPPMNQARQQSRLVQLQQGRQVPPSGLDQGGFGLPPHVAQGPDGQYPPQKQVESQMRRVPAYQAWESVGSQGYPPSGPARFGEPDPSSSQSNHIAPGRLNTGGSQRRPDPSGQRYDPTTGTAHRKDPATGKEMTWDPYRNRWV